MAQTVAKKNNKDILLSELKKLSDSLNIFDKNHPHDKQDSYRCDLIRKIDGLLDQASKLK